MFMIFVNSDQGFGVIYRKLCSRYRVKQRLLEMGAYGVYKRKSKWSKNDHQAEIGQLA